MENGSFDWDDFRYVQAVARAGTVRGAAELLGVHGSTVARRLDQLEQRVGTRLFARAASGMEMTSAGAEVIDALHLVAAELERVQRRLLSQGPESSGAVRLGLPRHLAVHLLIPELHGFWARHPDIELRLLTAPALQQLQSGAADLAICLTGEPPQDLIGRSLGKLMACPYRLRAASDGNRWVGSDAPASLSAIVHARSFSKLPLGLLLDDPELVAPALQAGLGVGLLSCYLGDALPELERVGAVGPVAEGEVWLLSRPESRGLARIQAVSAFLQDTFSSHRHALEGSDPSEKLHESA
ncbi:MAG: LysR family transcriptional regulator [Pseudomonadales bacterium]